MTTRRKFLEAAALASTLPITARLFVPSAAATPAIHRLHTVVVDQRWHQSRALAQAADPTGNSHAAILGDMTDLWFTNLEPHWRRALPSSVMALAGLTAHGPIFCLEELAREHGLRVVYRGIHESVDDQTIRHRFWGAVPDLAATPAWAAAVGSTVASIPCAAPALGSRAPADVEITTRATPPSETLVSWLIAPVARA